MKIFSSLVILGCLIMPVLSQAQALEIGFRCKGRNLEACRQKVTAELTAQNCGTVGGSIQCESIKEDPQATYCTAQTANCSEASSDGFRGITCRNNKIAIIDRHLTATWSVGWSWVRQMCKN